MKKIIMLLSLFSVVGIVAHDADKSAQKESLQEECENARLAVIATQEYKNHLKEDVLCRDIRQIVYNLETECQKSKNNSRIVSFLENSEECLALAKQKELLRYCRENLEYLRSRSESTPEYKKFRTLRAAAELILSENKK